MSVSDFIGAYAEGWTTGDVNKIIGSLAPSYVLDDPNAGQISKDGFAAYFQELSAALDDLRGGPRQGNFLDLTEVVMQETDGGVTVWCWWEAPGTGVGGGGLIKAGPEGILSERLTYYTKLPG